MGSATPSDETLHYEVQMVVCVDTVAGYSACGEVGHLEGIISDIVGKMSHVVRLAFNDASTGFPYIVPMNFALVEQEGTLILCFHCAKRGYKLELLAQDPRVTFEMECDVQLVYNPAHGHNTDIFKSVVGYGHAETVDAPEEKMALLQALVDRYHDHHLQVTETDAARCTIFKVSVTQIYGKEKKLSHS